VMADQVITTPGEALELVRRRAADMLTIKMLNGGLSAALRMRSICEAASLPYHVGGSATSRVVDAASVHFAAACPASVAWCEIGEFMGLDGDPARGLEVVDGMLRVPEGPGLGVSVAAEARIGAE
jgi:L-alanine-DL-glutamate epimerase-like enolase superfamily enzyme